MTTQRCSARVRVCACASSRVRGDKCGGAWVERGAIERGALAQRPEAAARLERLLDVLAGDELELAIERDAARGARRCEYDRRAAAAVSPRRERHLRAQIALGARAVQRHLCETVRRRFGVGGGEQLQQWRWRRRRRTVRGVRAPTCSSGSLPARCTASFFCRKTLSKSSSSMASSFGALHCNRDVRRVYRQARRGDGSQTAKDGRVVLAHRKAVTYHRHHLLVSIRLSFFSFAR